MRLVLSSDGPGGLYSYCKAVLGNSSVEEPSQSALVYVAESCHTPIVERLWLGRLSRLSFRTADGFFYGSGAPNIF